MKEESRLVRVRVIPNSGRSSIKRREDEIKVKVVSPAKKGKANEELLGILYRTFNTRRIEIVRGKRSQRKLIRIYADRNAVDKVIENLDSDD
jgi:uncharacterized protein (TIGR00251 family)